uniref:CAP-Gly domain-containing protein n=1 Tax=Poecilia mexicana TaxID=48701 RepID=A0A3B3XNM0_9TELE
MPLEMADAAAMAKELRTLLRQALPRPSSPLPLTLQGQVIPAVSDKARLQLASMGIRLGDRVVIAGQKVGTLRFCGSTEFSAGLWAGVELDKPEGKNDGCVAGVQYFTCRLKHIFAPLSKISKPLEKHKSSSTKPPLRPPRRIDVSRVTSKINTILSRSLSSSSSSLDSRHGSGGRPFRSRTPSGSSSLNDGSEVRQGERVLVAGQRTGVVQYCGKTSFAPVWLGIELDKPNGKNDGSVGGVRYFSCPPKHGVFAPPSRVQIHGSVDCLSELTTSRLRRSFSTSSAIATPKEGNRRSPVSSRSTPHRRRWSTLSGSSGGLPGSMAGSSLLSCSDGQVRLHVGMQVFLTSANEMAFIRFLGTTDFAPGLWLGLELRSPKGKNDGSVGGHRYFICRPGYGVLVRPSRVTYRGINGSHLVNEKS